MKKLGKKYGMAVAILMILLCLLGACKKGDVLTNPDFGKNSNAIAGSKISFLSIIHAAPKTGALDFSVDANRMNLSYFNYTNKVDYFRVSSGLRTFSLFYSGSKDTILHRNLNFAENKYYSLFIVDTLKNTEFVMIEDVPNSSETESVKVRLANMSPDIGPSDLYIENEMTPIARNINFKQASEFVSTKPLNNVILEITPTGKRFNVWARSAKLNLVKGSYYTIWAAGFKSIESEDGRIRAQVIRH